ncbi:MAG: lipopolysaccharide transport periplasmic protein LptA [Pseudomonadaceae bacterium]|nr:lipopolysaccharide transport periplasmic protein LptA [Pseudomonadaceae bacterium]
MTQPAYLFNKLAPFLLLTFLLLILFFISSPVAALPEDRQQPLKVEAQQMQWNNQQQLATYKGEVELQQGELRLKAAQLAIKRNPAGELEQAIASQPQGQAYMRDLPDATQPEIEAWGETIDYLPAKNLIILTGQAKLTQGKDSFAGHKLTYNLATQDIQAEQKSTTDARVEVILTPAPQGQRND